MSCADRILLLHALADGELDAANATALEQHLATCDACAAELRALQELRASLRRPELVDRAPASLLARIEQDLRPRKEPIRAPAARRSWGIAAGAVAALAASVVLWLLPGGSDALLREAVDDHVRGTLGSRVVDVQSSDQHQVKPWFIGRVDVAPPVPELSAAGFPLVGGRLDYLGRQIVAATVYRRRDHLLTLFVRADSGADQPAVVSQRDGYAVASWREHGLGFIAVTDASLDDARQFQEAFRAAVK